ncbi:unnamed protein product [Ixodes hexagonus]
MIVISFVMVFPLMFVPHWVSELNLLLLAFIEPFFLVMEVVQIVSLVRWINGCAQDGIDTQPTIWKALVISMTLICWVASVYFMQHLLKMDDTGLVVALLVLNLLAHLVNYYVDEGIDAAIVLLVSTLTLWLGYIENDVSDVVCSAVHAVEPGEGGGSLLSMLMTLPTISTGAVTRTLRGLGSLTRAAFWTGVVLRVSLAVAFVRGSLAGSGNDDYEYDRPKRLPSLLPVRVVGTALALVAYSQALWRQLDGCDHAFVRSSRSTQAVLLVLAYKAQLVFFGQSS